MGLLDSCIIIAISAPSVSPSGTPGPHFTNLDAWAQLFVANLSMASDGDGSAFGIHACLSSFLLITSRAKGGTSYGMPISFISSEFTGPAESNDIVKVPPLP